MSLVPIATYVTTNRSFLLIAGLTLNPQLQSLGEFKWPHKYENILNYGSNLSFAMSNPQSPDD